MVDRVALQDVKSMYQ